MVQTSGAGLPDAALLFRIGGDHGQAPRWAHGDGCIFQLYGAFDAFSCAIAHELDLPRPDLESFGRVGKRISAADPRFAHAVAVIVATREWAEMEELRNRAAHRGVLGQYIRAGANPPRVRVYLDPQTAAEEKRRQALPVLERLVSWAEGPLRWLWAAGEAWREPNEPSIIGTPGDLDVTELSVDGS